MINRPNPFCNIYSPSCLRFSEIKKVKIYATEGQSFKLHCKNETEGEFHKVVWLTNAHSNAKYPAYSYDLNHKTTIHKNFQNRVKRISGTSLEIRDAQKEDGGSWECNIVYNYRDRAKPTKDAQNRRVRLLAVYDVRVISKYSNRTTGGEIGTELLSIRSWTYAMRSDSSMRILLTSYSYWKILLSTSLSLSLC